MEAELRQLLLQDAQQETHDGLPFKRGVCVHT